jgi:WD40 repeat protein
MDSLNHHVPDPSDEHSSRSAKMGKVPPSLLSSILESVGKLPQGDQSPHLPEHTLKLIEALHDDAWYVRTAAVQQLGRLGERAALRLLLQALHDEHVSVRAAAVYALGQLGPYTPIDVLIRHLQDEEWQVRERAVLALSEQGVNAPVELLQTALYDSDSHVRETVGYALQALSTRPLPDSVGSFSGAISSEPTASMTIQTDTAAKNNLFKTIFSRFVPNKNPMQLSSIERFTIMQYPLLHHAPNVQPATTGKGKLRARILTSTLIAVAMITVLLFSWTVAQQHLYTENTSPHTSSPNANHLTPSLGGSQHKPGETLYTYTDPYHTVYSVAWSPDDKRIVLADGGSVTSMDTLTGAHKVMYIGNPDNYPGSVHTSVSWSPDGMRIAGSSSRLYIWDAAHGNPIVSYRPPVETTSTKAGGNGVIVSTTWSPDSKLLAFATNGAPYGFNVYVWNPQSQGIVFTQALNNTTYVSNKSVAWSPDGKYLAFINGTSVQVWNINQNKMVSILPASAFNWSPDSTRIAAIDPANGVAMDGPSLDPNYGTGVVIIWNVATRKEITHFKVADMSKGALPIDPIAWSPDGKHLLVVSTDISEWDIATQKNVLHYTGHPFSDASFPRDVAWSHSGQQVASAGGGVIGQASVKIWVP